MATLFYLLASISLVVGTAAIYLAMIEWVPVSWLYYHYFVRKPVTIGIIGLLLGLTVNLYLKDSQFPLWTIPPMVMVLLGFVLSLKMHQSKAFPAVDFPAITSDTSVLPLKDSMELAVIDYEGLTKCYPLDYVIHHHIVNDHFGEKIVALTYCAMCRSIIPFDVTEIGPLFVGSFKNANMIVADKATKTFYQQATFQSLIGKRHPSGLEAIAFQIMTWKDVKASIDQPYVVKVTKEDFRDFQLPIPGIWKKIMASESTPGLAGSHRDVRFPARTRVVGLLDARLEKKVVYLKKDIMDAGSVHNISLGFILVGHSGQVTGFRDEVQGHSIGLRVVENVLIDDEGKNKWTLRGKYIEGPYEKDLDLVHISDEYWFSWRRFHPEAEFIRN